MTKFALVGDVGGPTPAPALCDLASGEISRAKTYSGLDYPSLEAVVRVYLEEHRGNGQRRLYRHRMPDYRRLGGDDQPYLGLSLSPK